MCPPHSALVPGAHRVRSNGLHTAIAIATISIHPGFVGPHSALRKSRGETVMPLQKKRFRQVPGGGSQSRDGSDQKTGARYPVQRDLRGVAPSGFRREAQRRERDSQPHDAGERGLVEAREFARIRRGIPAALQTHRRAGHAADSGRGGAAMERAKARRQGSDFRRIRRFFRPDRVLQ